ncbi:MAG: DUF4388 domain-containing protein, partial [Acidobacteriota bacterium]
MELSGRLTSFPIAEILHWANNDARSGSLVVRAAGKEKEIFFQDGKIVTCLSDDPFEFYGQFLLLASYLDEDNLYRCLRLCRDTGRRLGAVLREEGILELRDIQRTLRFHIEDVICDIFLWDHGVFFFRTGRPPREELLAEPISPLGLALEGSHWVDEVKRIRRVLVDDDVVLEVAGGTEDGTTADQELTPRQRRILAEADGVRRLEALYAVVRGSFYRFLLAAAGLVEAGRLRVTKRRQRLHAPQRDAGLDDLLWQQANREQPRNRPQAGPLVDLERYIPLWVRRPPEEEWRRMPDRARAFYRRFDGRRRLTELLSADDRERRRQLDLLMLQIGKEAVALLPVPVSQLPPLGEIQGVPELLSLAGP